MTGGLADRARRWRGRPRAEGTNLQASPASRPRCLCLQRLFLNIRSPTYPPTNNLPQAKADRVAEIKRLNGAIAALRSELGKKEEALADCGRWAGARQTAPIVRRHTRPAAPAGQYSGLQLVKT